MLNKLFKNKYSLTIIQFFTLTVFVLLIYGAIGVGTNDSDFAKVLRNTNLPNLIVWSYWWPLIIVTAIFFGRFWCTICPVELITSFFGKIGFRKKPGVFLKSGWIITLFYAVILVLGIHTLAIHRIPQYMAIYMLILFAIAAIVGLIWEKRTFCTYVCPIGHLLGLYSLLSFKKLRVIDVDVCKTCKTKDCVSKNNYYKFIGRSCTSELYPEKLKDNRDCILCGQCFKSCTHNNVAIQKQKMAADIFTNIKLSWAEIVFFVIVSGFVVYEILSGWKVTKEILMATPNLINGKFNVSGNLKGMTKAVTLFILLPSLFYFVLALIKKYFTKETWQSAFTQLVLAILPITASMHLLKAILKTTSRIPYWNYAIIDTEGVKSAELIINNPDLIKNQILTNVISPTISIVAIIISIIGFIISIYVIRKQEYVNKLSKTISVLAAIIYFFVFFATLVIWRMM